MPRTNSRLDYTVHIISKKSDMTRSLSLFEKKRTQISLSSPSRAEANSLANQSSYVLYRDESLLKDYKQACRMGHLSEDFVSNWGALMTLAAFANDFCRDENSNVLLIRINESDIEGFRIASFLASFCKARKREFTISTFSEKEVLPLYEPPVNSSTLFVLFSLVDYLLKNGDFPVFDQLKECHFSNIGLAESQRMSWNSANDSRYVAALYATLRVLQRLSLIQKEFHVTQRKMVGIKPTVNGLLAVLFSEYFGKFKSSPPELSY